MEPAQFSRREILKNDLTSIFSRYWPAALALAVALPAAYAQKAGQPPAVPGSGGYAPAAILVLLLLLLEGYAIRRGVARGQGTCTWPGAVLLGVFPLLGLGEGALLPALLTGFVVLKAGFALFSRVKTGSCEGYNPCIWISLDFDLFMLAATYSGPLIDRLL